MYVPPPFAVTDQGRLHAAIEAYSFATLVSSADGRMQASHLPLLLDRKDGPRGVLIGHMARANTQWQAAAGTEVLAIFHGPHAYVSPSWYEAEHVVPTWNYVTVHAYGTLTLVDEPAALSLIVARTVHQYEAVRENPWQLDAQSELVRRLLPQIVGFRIPIERLEGKWKLNQNHPPARRQKVARALADSPREADRQVAAVMLQSLEKPEQA